MHDQSHRALPMVIVRDGLASRDFDESFPTLMATPEEISVAEEYLRQELVRRQANNKVIDGQIVPKPLSVRVSAVVLLGAVATALITARLYPDSAGIAAASVIPAIYLFLVCLWRYELAHHASN